MIRPQIVLCVPGPWSSRPALLAALAQREIVLAGELLSFRGKHLTCELRMESDPRLERAFRTASSRVEPSLGDEDFRAVAQHASVLYVLSGQYGPDDAAENAHRMMRLGCALIDAGGIAVKCESSGLAHSAARWRALTELADQGLTMIANGKNDDDKERARWRFWLPLRQAYVFSPLGAKGELYSCGMHLLGRRDAKTARGSDDHATNALLTEFSEYVLAECGDDSPKEGEHFRAAKDAPRWRISTEPCAAYEEDDFFFNPYGYFRLQPADASR